MPQGTRIIAKTFSMYACLKNVSENNSAAVIKTTNRRSQYFASNSNAIGSSIPIYQALNFELATQISTNMIANDFLMNTSGVNSRGIVTSCTDQNSINPSLNAFLIQLSTTS